MNDIDKYFNKGNDCDCCLNQYPCGRDGDEVGCKCKDEGKKCKFLDSENDL